MRIVLEKYDHLSFLLDSLIYLSIVKSGRVNYRFDPIQVEDSLRKVSEYFSFKAGDRGISIKKEVEDKLPLIMGDVEYIPFIFRSLIDNAIKFSPDGGNIYISVFEDQGDVHISIKDEGIGIPMKELSHIFDRFYQIDGSNSRRYGGNGLGLYVSKSIVEIHGGNIWIESEEGRGTTVHVIFPGYIPE
ncbi:HAMP domain-containing sensor histidine kinase [Methanolobus sp. ZRKC3]|uniref:sensor histidine kinase n=1 Tax=Methanolobus sp. ZRKC3 TaxID=3125786 RepID=UPI00325610EE